MTRVHLIERAPSPWTGKRPESNEQEVRYTRADFEYFRTKPAKNWRIRPRQTDERSQFDAQISVGHEQVIVFRPRPFPDSSFIFLKANITTGPHNDVADPWMYVFKSALRASTVWKNFQVADLDAGFTLLIDTLEKEAAENHDQFEEWCFADIDRTARLSWSLYASAPLLREFSNKLDELFGRMSFDEIRQKLLAANTNAADPSLLDNSLPLLSGWKIVNFWGTHDNVTIWPEEDLVKACSWFADVAVVLPCPAVLVDITTTDDVHGYLFASFRDARNEPILQLGELDIDGRIAFIEFAGIATWVELREHALRGDVISNAEAFDKALRVLSYYALHRRTSPTDVRRRIGLEILPADHPLHPKPKEPTMTAPVIVQKPPVAQKSTPISEILARIERAYEDRQAAHTDRITALRQALEAYSNAAKDDLVIDFAKRNGVENPGELRAPDAALYLATLVDGLPEMGKKESVETAPSPVYEVHIPARQLAVTACEDVQTTNDDLAKIRARFTAGHRIVLIGGKWIPAKMPWLKSVLGYEPEWIGTEDESGSRESQALVGRIERREFVGVVFFQAFMSHKMTEPLVAAGREFNVPVVAGGRAGQGEITRALLGIERAL